MSISEGLIYLSLILSWLGTFILIIRGFPQAFKSYQEGHSQGLSSGMLWLWMSGSLMVLPHLYTTGDFLLSAVYIANILSVSIMLKYFYFPSKK